MVKAKMEEPKAQYLKPDVYTATYGGCEEHEITKDGKTKKVLRHYWHVGGIEINEISDVIMTPKNKLGAIAECLMGRKPSTDEEIDFDKLAGKKARIVIKDKAVGDRTFSTITDHLQV